MPLLLIFSFSRSYLPDPFSTHLCPHKFCLSLIHSHIDIHTHTHTHTHRRTWQAQNVKAGVDITRGLIEQIQELLEITHTEIEAPVCLKLGER
jgi:hypothetical protein